MPIEGLTDQKRLPRLGKIHLGVKKIKKVKGKADVEYPSATDYFVCPPEVTEVFGEKPKELDIIIPVEDEEQWASQYYRAYSQTRGLICKGDGKHCDRSVDISNGALPTKDTKEVARVDGNCNGRDCPDYKAKKCKEMLMLQFMLPTVKGLGIWQIDSSSINSIRNINANIELIRGVYGRIAMIPLKLTIEPIEVIPPEGNVTKKTVHVLNLRSEGTMLELYQAAKRGGLATLLPAPDIIDVEGELLPDLPFDTPVPDDETPDRILPHQQAPAGDEPEPDTKIEPETAAEELFPQDQAEAQAVAASAKEKEQSDIPQTLDETFQLIADKKKWKSTDTVRTWLVNVCKIPEMTLDAAKEGDANAIRRIYEEVMPMLG